MDDEFYIDLMSNVTSSASNTMAKFKTILPKTLKLFGQWEVGLVEISFTKSWFNVKNEFYIKYSMGNSILDASSYIQPGYYKEPKQLLSMLNEAMLKVYYHQDERKLPLIPPELRYNDITRRITVSAGKDQDNERYFFPYFGKEVNSMLGLRTSFKQVKYEISDHIFDKNIYFD